MPKKYFNFVLGCQMNESDAERISSVYKNLGFVETLSEADADIITVISCAVRQSAMDRIYTKIHKWKQIKAKRPLLTILTGCVLPADKIKLEKEFDIFFNIKTLSQVPELIAKKLEDQKYDLPTADYFSIEPKYENTFKAYVPIMTGCNKYCTYCAVPYTRGPEVSRPYDEIMNEVIDLVKKGYKEIMLIGQNVNSYANDLPKGSKKFHDLLHDINLLPGDFWLRFTSSHPYDMSDELIETMKERNHLCEQFHLPVQAGDNTVLKKMNRHYTIEHYQERIQKLREAIPEIAISTDVIVGFPFEDEKAFQKTINLFEECKFDMAYISRYSVRPGTAAERAFEDTISSAEKARRENELNNVLIQHALNFNKNFVGSIQRVLVDRIKTSKEDTAGIYINLGKNRAWKTISFKAGRNFVGEFVDVKITEADNFALKGELVEANR